MSVPTKCQTVNALKASDTQQEQKQQQQQQQQPFYGPLSGTTPVRWYQKKTFTHSHPSYHKPSFISKHNQVHNIKDNKQTINITNR